VSGQGIKVDLDKVKAIQIMLAPKTKKEVRGFLGCLHYITLYVSQMTSTCEAISRLI
jgi:hypothetical protein